MDNLAVFCAKYLIVFVLLGWIAVWLRLSRHYKLQFIAATVIGGVVALILSRLAGKLYYDPRPFVSHHVTPLIAHAPDNGFPSDHSLFAMALTAITYAYSRKAAAGMLILTILIGIGRVVAKVHSPIDIIGAWIIGAAGACIGYFAIRWFLARRQPSDIPPAHR